MKTSTPKIQQKLLLLVALSLVMALSLSTKTNAISADLIYSPSESSAVAAIFGGEVGADGDNTVSYNGLKKAVAWKINTDCPTDILSIRAESEYYATYETTDEQDGILFVGDIDTLTSLGSVSNITDGFDAPPLIYSDIGGTNNKDGILGGTWANETNLSGIYVAYVISGNSTYSDGTTTMNKPTVDITYAASLKQQERIDKVLQEVEP